MPSQAAATVIAACLPTGEAAEEALLQLGRDHGFADGRFDAATRELLPTLEASLAARRCAVPRPLQLVVRSARALEELRGPAVREAVADVLGALHEAGAEPVIVGDCAGAERLHGGWSSRHCGRLDVLVPDARLHAAARAVNAVVTGTSALGHHRSGFPVAITTRAFGDAPHAPVERLGTTPAEVAGVRVRVLDPAHALVHHCASSGLRLPSGLGWALDAAMLLLRDGTPRDLPAVAARHRVATTTRQRLRWLRRTGAPVATPALGALRRPAAVDVVRLSTPARLRRPRGARWPA